MLQEQKKRVEIQLLKFRIGFYIKIMDLKLGICWTIITMTLIEYIKNLSQVSQISEFFYQNLGKIILSPLMLKT